MSTENLDCTYSLPAAADLSAKQGFGITINSSGQVAVATANAVVHGFLHNAPKSGEQARFVHNGKVLKLKAAGNIAVGDSLVTHASGWVKGTTGQLTQAIALQAAAAGDVFSALALPNLPTAP